MEWYRRRLSPEVADWPAYLVRRRRQMLELWNVGCTCAEIGQWYGIVDSTVGHGVRRVVREAAAADPVAEPVLYQRFAGFAC